MSRKKKKRKKRYELASQRQSSQTTVTVADLKGRGFVHYAKGKEYFLQGEYQDALSEWTGIAPRNRPAELFPLFAEAHFRVGLNLYNDENLPLNRKADQIISELSQAVSLQPEKAIYHFHLGLAFEHLGNSKKARASYRKAASLDPANQRFYSHLAMAYIRSDQLEMAFELLANQQRTFLTDLCLFLIDLKMEEDPPFPELTTKDSSQSAGEQELIYGLLHLMDNSAEQAKARFEKGLVKSEQNGDKPILSALLSYFSGLTYLRNQDVKQGEKYWQRTLETGLNAKRYLPNLISFCWNKGIEAVQSGDLQQGRKWFEALLSRKPDHQAAQKNLERICFLQANALAQEGDWKQALSIWQSSCYEDDLNAFHNIALACDKLEDPKKANVHWQKVVQTYEEECRDHPDDPLKKEYLAIAYQHLVSNYRNSGDYNRATKTLKKMSTLKPDDSGLNLELAESYIEDEKWNSARRQLESILSREPEHIDALMNLALVQEMQFDNSLAISTLEKAVSLEPENSDARRQLGSILNEEAFGILGTFGDIQKAAELFKRQIELDPSHYGGYYGLGQVYLRGFNDSKAAEKLFEQYIQTDPDNPEVFIRVGNTYLDCRFPRKANSYFKKAEILAGNDPQLLIHIGQCMYDHSKRQAEIYFKKAIALDPENAELCFDIGFFYAMKDLFLAKKYLEKCLEIDKSHVRAHMDLSLIYLLLGDEKRAKEYIVMAKRLAKIGGKEELIERIEAIQRTIDERLNPF